jgi:DNA mismatch repair ATPase MutL
MIRTLTLDDQERIMAQIRIPDFTSLIRELMENSLDAFADYIKVSLSGDLCDICVEDNGEGISAAILGNLCKTNASCF